MDKSFSDIFKPGTYPQRTYVSRHSHGTKFTYEERLRQSLLIDGYLTYIVGPSKIGKTVLCENVIGRENMVSMSGNDFSKEYDFWSGIAKKIGISMTAKISEETASLSGSEQRSTIVIKDYFATKDRVIKYFNDQKKILVLDDFHYAPPEIQYDIACQLKEVIRSGFKAVVISLPYRSDDAIRLNPDLTGRISIIEIEPWKKEELVQIANIGFTELNITLEEMLVAKMAEESIHSPQLMQAICLNIGLLPEKTEKITESVIEESCRFTCMNLPYADVVRVLKAGPPTRGQKRLKYTLRDGSEQDIYSLILKILADNPPLVELNIEELMERIKKNIDDNIIKRQDAKELLKKKNIGDNTIKQQKVKDALKNWQKILETQGSLYQVLEWKDDVIYILDNMFLFYIRWGLGKETIWR